MIDNGEHNDLNSIETIGGETYDEIAQRNYELGQVIALERLAATLFTEAGKQFSSKDKQAAGITYNFAEMIEKKAEEERAKYMAKHHCKCS
jgi:hypothetical protein